MTGTPEPRVPGRVHRYSVDEIWGKPPKWLRDMHGDPEAFILDTYRGKISQWEIEKGGEIIYGWAGDYAGVSPAAVPPRRQP